MGPDPYSVSVERAHEAPLRDVIDHAPLVLFALDGEGVFTLSTGKGLEALGLGEGEIVGQSVFDVCRDYPHMLDVNRRALGGESVRESVRLGSLEFDVRVEPSLDPDGQVIGATGIALDTTEQRALETQLRQSQKMNAIGQMAGGIAHDFNNLLTAIAGHCELLLEGLHDRPDLRNHPEEIARTVDLAASLTQRLLAFGRRGIVRPETLDLNEVLTGMQLLLGGLVPETIGLVVKRSPGRSWVLTDRVQLEQAVINLVVNARDAMPEGGTLRLTTEQRAEPPARAVRGLEPAPGPYVVLSVQDTGHGIDPEIEEQMFEPFFTTKGHPPVGWVCLPCTGSWLSVVSRWRSRVRSAAAPPSASSCPGLRLGRYRPTASPSSRPRRASAHESS